MEKTIATLAYLAPWRLVRTPSVNSCRRILQPRAAPRPRLGYKKRGRGVRPRALVQEGILSVFCGRLVEETPRLQRLEDQQQSEARHQARRGDRQPRKQPSVKAHPTQLRSSVYD